MPSSIVKLALCLGVASLSSAAAAQNAPVRLTVQADRPGPKYDRNIFGQFAEHLGTGIYGGVWVGKTSKIPNVRGVRSDVVAALKAIRVPNVRWPGGCFADEYHWRDGIGDPAKRKVTINSNWGGAIENNAFGTDEFFDFIGQIGAEAYVSVNLGSGTVQEAADWVAYMTGDPRSSAGKERAANGHVAPYKVKFLGLGNESWSCGGAMTPEHYVDQMKQFARFIRNFNPAQQSTANPAGDTVVREPMQRIAVGPGDAKTIGYTEAVMKAWKEHDWAWAIEGLSLHNYTVVRWPPAYASVGFGEKEYAEIVQDTLRMEDLIRSNSAVMDKYDPEKKVPLVIDEWGTWYGKLPGSPEGFLQQQNSMRDAVIAALNLNMFSRHADRVRATAIAQMVNVLQAMILTDGPKMVLTPTYHVYKMYVPFQDATVLPIEFSAGTYRIGDISLPRVDGMAARATDGRIWVALTNVDPNRPAEFEASVAGLTARGASGSVLTAPAVDTVNTFDNPNAVVPRPIAATVRNGKLSITLPPKSVAVLALQP
jgi:alpha-L-arabinofuranosidase